MSASLFDLYCLEVVPEHMAEVERLYLQWKDAFARCIDGLDGPDSAQLEAQGCAHRQAYEDALDAARKAFDEKWMKGGAA